MGHSLSMVFQRPKNERIDSLVVADWTVYVENAGFSKTLSIV